LEYELNITIFWATKEKTSGFTIVITAVPLQISNLAIYLQNTVSLSVKLSTMLASGDISFKEDLQKLIFLRESTMIGKKDEFRT
jgi:hypothetical protein